MKKYSSFIVLLSFFVAVLISSCAPNPQKKAESLIKPDILKTLHLPNTYQSVETVLDTAKAPLYSPEFINLVVELFDKLKEEGQVEAKMKSAKSDMALWYSLHMSSYCRNEYENAKETYEAAKSKYDGIHSRVDKICNRIEEMTRTNEEFIGFRAYHTFRCQNNEGETFLYEVMYILDKDLTTILGRWDKEDMELYNKFMDGLANM